MQFQSWGEVTDVDVVKQLKRVRGQGIGAAINFVEV